MPNFPRSSFEWASAIVISYVGSSEGDLGRAWPIQNLPETFVRNLRDVY